MRTFEPIRDLSDFLERLRASSGSAEAVIELHQILVVICDPSRLPREERLEAEGMLNELRKSLLRCGPRLRKMGNANTLSLDPKSFPEMAALLSDVVDHGREFVRLWNPFLVGEYDAALGYA